MNPPEVPAWTVPRGAGTEHLCQGFEFVSGTRVEITMSTSPPVRSKSFSHVMLINGSKSAHYELQNFEVPVGGLAKMRAREPVEGIQSNDGAVRSADAAFSYANCAMELEPAMLLPTHSTTVPMARMSTAMHGAPGRASRPKHLRVLALLNNASRSMSSFDHAMAEYEANTSCEAPASGLKPNLSESTPVQGLVGIESHFRRAMGLGLNETERQTQGAGGSVILGSKRARGGFGEIDIDMGASMTLRKGLYDLKRSKSCGCESWGNHFPDEFAMEGTQHAETWQLDAMLPQLSQMPQMVSMVHSMVS